MKILRLKRASVAFALAVLGWPGFAHAEGEWTAPGGAFELAFPESWGVVDATGSRPPEVLVHFGQTTTVVERKRCYIDVIPVAGYDGLDQPAINERVARWSQDDALHVFSGGRPTPFNVVDYESANVDGVQVATLHSVATNPGDDIRIRQRLFILTEQGVARRFNVLCFVIDQEARTDDVDALLASLHFPH